MTDQRHFYVTTPIYYVNDVPHLGHAYTTIVADAFARYARRRDQQGAGNTYFVTGTDEHGQKIQRAAEAQNKTPQALADHVVQRFEGLWQTLGISHDDFIRTTEDRHKAYVQALWQKLADRGDIYKDTYSGWYSVADEAYYTEKDIEDLGLDKGTLEFREEESYFFRLSAYQDKLLDYYEQHPAFIRPRTRLNEVRSFVSGGLQDLSISRTAIDWGIPVPGDEAHVMYVWLDALANYISVLGGEQGALYGKFWPASLHLIGKDILRFHAVYWPAFLMSAGLPLPETIVAHGWWTIEGQKMSKRLRNVVDPYFLIEEYGRDVVRYFVLREVPLGQDGDFSHRQVLARMNAELANDLGNLVSRVAGMIRKYFEGALPAADGARIGDKNLAESLSTMRAEVDLQMLTDYRPDKALDAIWECVRTANRFVDHAQPWTLAKEGKNEDLQVVLRDVATAILDISYYLDALMPDTTRQIRQMLLPEGALDEASWTLDALPDTLAFEIGSTVPLFPRLSDKEIAVRLEKIEAMQSPESGGSETRQAAVVPEKMPEIGIDQFFESQLIAGRVESAEKVPKSSKLLKLKVDLGEDTARTIVSGIAKSYAPEDLVGKKVIVVANLKSAKLMGIESQGMVLAAESGDQIHVIEPHPDVPVGMRVK